MSEESRVRVGVSGKQCEEMDELGEAEASLSSQMSIWLVSITGWFAGVSGLECILHLLGF